jgi:thiamine-phosphate pyrophosphorylase
MASAPGFSRLCEQVWRAVCLELTYTMQHFDECDPTLDGMLRYAITDRRAYGGDSISGLLRDVEHWASAGIDFIQIREKDLAAAELVELTRRVLAAVRNAGGATRVLVNSRGDVAAATGADGVHLTSRAGELTAGQVREVYAGAALGLPVLSLSCHRLDEVRRASALGVDAVLFGPVFGKTVDGDEVMAPVGLEALGEACRAASGTKVLALGSVTPERAAECVAMGAAGLAGIRLFQSGRADRSSS